MGVPSGFAFPARRGDAARGADGGTKAPRHGARLRRRAVAGLIALLCLLFALPLPAGTLRQETLRIATWNIGFERAGPGILLRDIAGGRDPQVAAAMQVMVALDADVILLAGFDHDHGRYALDAFRMALAQAGLTYPYRFAANPNTGLPTGLDMDRNGRLSEPRDAQGWGHFPGAGGMAILSRLPLDESAFRDFSTLLWADLPSALLPGGMTDAERATQRLSTTAHWDIPVTLPTGDALHLLAWHATPPVFDGPEDRNGRRNHDEAAFWSAYLDNRLAQAPPARFVLLGDANLDPQRGEGRPAALRALLADPRLTDPLGMQPTVDYGPPLGALRLDYILPSAALRVTASGVMRPEGQPPPLAAALAAASRHWPVWIDLAP